MAEDNSAFRRLLARELRSDGYEVVEVEDGDALIRHLAPQDGVPNPRADLVITDIDMPHVTGLAAIAALVGSGFSVKFLCISEFCSDEISRAARSLGACAVLSKPFDLDELCALVRQLLGRASTPLSSRDVCR